jgi:hypothetical protein
MTPAPERAPAVGNSRPRTPVRWQRFLPLLVILIVLAAGYALGLHRYPTLEQLSGSRKALESFAGDHFALALALYMLAYAAAVAVMFPAPLGTGDYPKCAAFGHRQYDPARPTMAEIAKRAASAFYEPKLFGALPRVVANLVQNLLP